ncbi:MAG TPA: hypothetical protein PLR71_04740 [Deltaproteobacteria bacterium]|nr:hypothetical protein [Deltaproteobacteria bacterium]HQI80851.1 hypothetical protein [Deltaproteobacteria bacterium]
MINIIKKEKDEQYQRKVQDDLAQERIEDIVSVENRQASRSRVESVDEARAILSSVTRDMESVSSDLYKMNFQRVSKIIN